jgi:hypothetical protein
MGTPWVKVYFGMFYYFSVVIGINIAVAFAIDMYCSVLRMDEERMKTLNILERELSSNSNYLDTANTSLVEDSYEKD